MYAIGELEWRRHYIEGAKAAGRPLLNTKEELYAEPPSPHEPGWEDDAWKAGWWAGLAGRIAVHVRNFHYGGKDEE